MTLESSKATVYYDGNCKLCQVSVDLLKGQHKEPQFELVNVHTATLPEGLDTDTMLEEIYITLPDGSTLTNADAVLYIAYQYWYMRPLVWFGRLPGVVHILRIVYGFVARNRYVFGHTTHT